jgi:hypothetical protein
MFKGLFFNQCGKGPRLPDTQNIDLLKNQIDVADRLRILDRITIYKNKKLSTN